jgi:hypothetical protein
MRKFHDQNTARNVGSQGVGNEEDVAFTPWELGEVFAPMGLAPRRR